MLLPAAIDPRSFLGQDAVSFSEIGTLARCEAAWNYSYGAPDRERTPPTAAMSLGKDTDALYGAYHMGQDAYSENETAMWLMRRYAEYYKGDKVRMLDVQVPVAALLPAGPYFFGFADGLAMYRRQLWVVELKTTQVLSNVDYLERTLQTRLYVWALRQMGMPVVGAMLDVIRSFKPVRKELPLAESFDRRWAKYSDAELMPAVAEAMAAVAVRRQLADRVRVPLKNIGSSCSWCSSNAVCFNLDVEILPEADEF
jgi:hypothetical protein